MALLFVAIALFAVLGLALMAVSSSRSQQQPQNKHQPANQYSAADPGKAETDKPKPDHGTEIHKAQNYWERFVRFIETREKFITATSTIFIAAFTTILAFATGFLYVATRDLVDGAEQTAERQLRAYVFATPIHTDVRPDGKAISIKYSLENTGDTPAYNIRHAADIRLLPFPLPSDVVVDSPTDFTGGMSLGKGVPHAGQRIQDFDLATIKDKAFYLVVIIKYDDTFGRHRTTRLCAGADIAGSYNDFISRREKDASVPGAGNLEWYYPTQHNDSD